MKKISQIVIKIIIILLIQIVLVPTNLVSANGGMLESTTGSYGPPDTSYTKSFWGTIFQAGDDFIQEGKDASGDTIQDSSVKGEFNRIYNILFGAGIALSVIIGAILGIKFMVSTVEEQAKIKEMLIPYILGCAIIFGAFGIWKLAINIFSNI